MSTFFLLWNFEDLAWIDLLLICACPPKHLKDALVKPKLTGLFCGDPANGIDMKVAQ